MFNHLKINNKQIYPIDGVEFALQSALYLLSLGLLSFLYFKIYFLIKENNPSHALMFAYIAGVTLAITVIVFSNKFMRLVIARAKSIDPQYHKVSYRRSILHLSPLIYSPVFFILLILFMSLSKPRLFSNQLKKYLNVFAGLSFFFVLISFATIQRNADPLNTIARSDKDGVSLVSFVSGPSVFYINNILFNIKEVHALQAMNHLQLDAVLKKTSQVCAEPTIHIPLVQVMIIKKLTSNQKRSVASEDKLKVLNYSVKGLSNCAGVKILDKRVNPVWFFQPTAVMEGLLLLVAREKAGYDTAVKLKNRIQFHLNSIEINNKNKNQIVNLKTELDSFKSF